MGKEAAFFLGGGGMLSGIGLSGSVRVDRVSKRLDRHQGKLKSQMILDHRMKNQ